jgi:glucose/arabinose dehydrogenase
MSFRRLSPAGLGLLLCGLLALAMVLAGCSGSGNDASGDDGTPVETATPEPTEEPSPEPTPIWPYTLTPVIEYRVPYVTEFAIFPDRPDFALLASQSGDIYIASMENRFQPFIWGTLADEVTQGYEEGLLSLAFSPNYEEDRWLYVYYTRGFPESNILARFRASAGGGLERASKQMLLEIPQRHDNHNGGRIVFGEDGYLYLSLGDGGGLGDPDDLAQDLSNLYGTIIRIDVSPNEGYDIPPGNPFVGVEGARPEIWAYGLRNPWRIDFDPETGEMWAGDVGEDSWEEVNRIVRGGNYGWSCYEGNEPFRPERCPEGTDVIFPHAVHGREESVALVGGNVYRGEATPELYGHYIYADFFRTTIWAVDTAPGGTPRLLIETGYFIASFTQLPDGELAGVTHFDGVFRLVNNPALEGGR